jgi:hypothetical protein
MKTISKLKKYTYNKQLKIIEVFFRDKELSDEGVNRTLKLYEELYQTDREGFDNRFDLILQLNEQYKLNNSTSTNLRLAVDSEFVDNPNYGKFPVSLCVVREDQKTLHLFSDELDEETKEQVEQTAFNQGKNFKWVKFGSFEQFQTIINFFYNGQITKMSPMEMDEIEKRKNKGYIVLDLLMFYSPKDIEYTLPIDLYKDLLKFTTQTRRIKVDTKDGLFNTGYKINNLPLCLKVTDLVGLSVGGLKTTAEGLGLKMDNKNSLDALKDRMHIALKEQTEDFLKYAEDDTKILFDIEKVKLENINHIVNNVIGVDYEYTIDNLKRTQGSLVADIFEKWIYSQSDNVKKTLDELGEYQEKGKKRIQISTGLELASIGYLHKRMAYSGNGVLANIVLGGRCHNEAPAIFHHEYGADIDLASCYGSKLREFKYPLGMPTIIATNFDQEKTGKTLKLGEILKEYEKDFIPGLWFIVLEGQLSFRCDLFLSKLVEAGEIAKKIKDSIKEGGRDDDSDAFVDADTVILYKEIKNGILTHQSLKALQKIASNSEWKEIKNLNVKCLVAYFKDNYIESIDEWCNSVSSNRGQIKNINNNAWKVEDDRTHKFTLLNIDDFIGKLVDHRGQLKKASKLETDLNKKARLTAQQNEMKLMINTLYGVLVSPYFKIGNVVIGNNITDAARVGAWMFNKALFTRQSITDGGIYEPWRVSYLTTSAKRPSLDTLASMSLFADSKKGRKFAPMKDINGKEVDWKVRIQEIRDCQDKEKSLNLALELGQLADQAALIHINNFFSIYNKPNDSEQTKLLLPFKIEHKAENFFIRASTFSKADYCLDRAYYHDELGIKQYLYKIRGAKDFEETEYLKKSPKYRILFNLLNGNKKLHDLTFDYHHPSLLKINLWKRAQESQGYSYLEGKMPGDRIVQERDFRMNNKFNHHDTVEEYQTTLNREKRSNKPSLFEQKGFTDDYIWEYLMMLRESLKTTELGEIYIREILDKNN